MSILSVSRVQGIYGGKWLIHIHRIHVFPEHWKSSFLRLVQSNQFLFIFWGACILQTRLWSCTKSTINRPFREQHDQEGRISRKCGFHEVRSRGRARGHGSRVSRLDNKGVTNSCHNIESERGLAIGVMGPKTDVSIVSFLAAVALWRGFLATEDSVEEQRWWRAWPLTEKAES